jgi:hypothetical protein
VEHVAQQYRASGLSQPGKPSGDQGRGRQDKMLQALPDAVRNGSGVDDEAKGARMKTKEAVMLGAGALAVIANILQVVEAWPNLTTRLTTLRLIAIALVHTGALILLVAIYLKSRKDRIRPDEVLLIAVTTLVTWSIDLGTLAR